MRELCLKGYGFQGPVEEEAYEVQLIYRSDDGYDHNITSES